MQSATEPSVAAVVLAAGASRRMGRAKQLLPFQGTTLVRHAVYGALQSACRPVVVVLGCRWEEIARELQGLAVEIALNPDWQLGMSTSIRSGLKELKRRSAPPSAIILMTCDQPAVDGNLLNRLADLHLNSGAQLAACRYKGNLGVPALFGASFYAQLGVLQGDEGARSILRRNDGQVEAVEFPEGELDLDRPSDLEAWRQTAKS